MSGWVKKRFWKDVEVTQTDAGFAISLDGRALKTPAKASLVVPTRALADLIAQEWRDQGEVIDPETMPATRAANAALDKVHDQHSEVAEMITAYGDSDLVCYRACGPDVLVAREADAWDPVLDWAAHRYTIRPIVREGVIHGPQPEQLLQDLHADVARLDAFELTAFHDLVSLSGSLLIALAVIDSFASPEELWNISRIDEDYQIEQWGEDEEARKLAEGRKAAFLNAARFYFALQSLA